MVNMDHPLMFENVWLDKWRVEDAEIHYQEHLAGTSKPKEEEHQKLQKRTPHLNPCAYRPVSRSRPAGVPDGPVPRSELSREIARARQQIQKSLKSDNVPVGGITDNAVVARIESLEKENKELRKVTNDLRQLVTNMEKRISTLEAGSQTTPAATPQKEEKKTEKKEDDDDFELFGSDDEEEKAEAEKIKEERIKQYAEKKAKKPVLIAKSNIILDVKPWDDETDMAKLEKAVRSVQMDGLLWGASKLVAVGYGIRKLQISCVVEDDKVSTDDLEERITAFEEFIQSMDIAAFNKV